MAGAGRIKAGVIGLAAALAAAGPATAGGLPSPEQGPAPDPIRGPAGGASRLAAASQDPFSALVGERRERRIAGDRQSAVERFTVAADGRAFLLEGGIGAARIKFLCTENDPRLDCRIDPEGPAEEIYLVSGARGPRGDVIYKNREGDVLLRMTAYGGATVFWPGDPRSSRGQGQAASRSFGEDGPLVLPPADETAAERRGRTATAHLSAATGEPIVFQIAVAPANAAGPAGAATLEGGAPPPANAKVLSDAVVRVAVGMRAVASDPTGARILGARVKAVEFRQGTAPSLSLDGTRLVVVYDPSGDVAGRPSSSAVARFLEESL